MPKVRQKPGAAIRARSREINERVTRRHLERKSNAGTRWHRGAPEELGKVAGARQVEERTQGTEGREAGDRERPGVGA